MQAPAHGSRRVVRTKQSPQERILRVFCSSALVFLPLREGKLRDYGLIWYTLHSAFHSLLTAKPLLITCSRVMPFFISPSQ